MSPPQHHIHRKWRTITLYWLGQWAFVVTCSLIAGWILLPDFEPKSIAIAASIWNAIITACQAAYLAEPDKAGARVRSRGPLFGVSIAVATAHAGAVAGWPLFLTGMIAVASEPVVLAFMPRVDPRFILTTLAALWLLTTAVVWWSMRRTLYREAALARLSGRLVIGATIAGFFGLAGAYTFSRVVGEAITFNFIICVTAVPVGGVFICHAASWVYLRRLARLRAGWYETHCHECGYNLAATEPGERCPECGNVPGRRAIRD